MKRKIFSLILIVVMLAVTRVSAQGSTDVKLVKAQSLTEMMSVNEARHAVLSPDGKIIAYSTQDSLCLYMLADQSKNCTSWPPLFREIPSLNWSPDSKYITFTENFFMYFRISNIWVFDVAKGIITDRTDQGVHGNFLKFVENKQPVDVDFLPTWNPATGDLYFFRSRRDQSTITLALYRMAPDRGDPMLVGDLTTYFSNAPYPFYSMLNEGFLDGPTTISPDGKQIAGVARLTKKEDFRNGIWTIDLSDGTPHFDVSSAHGFNGGLPSWQRDPLPVIQSLAWTKDQAGLVFVVENLLFDTTGVWHSLYYVDLKTHTVTPLLDFSKVASQPDFFKIGDNGRSPAAYQPGSAVLLRSKNLVLGINGNKGFGATGVTAIKLPPDTGDPAWLGNIDSFKLIPTQGVSVSTDETKVLMFGYLLTLQ